MMLASVSAWRLRAVARLLLARRAVARRTERAGGAAAELPSWAGIACSCCSGSCREASLGPSTPGMCSPSLWWVGAKGRGLEPRAFNELGPDLRAGGWAVEAAPTDPAVKTGNPSLPPRGAGNRAVGGIPAWAGILAAGPATYQQYSYPEAVM
jgi:hypothetical protein